MGSGDARLFYLGAVALVSGVYAVKELALRYASRPWAAALFGFALAVAVPVAWALDPDWDNPHVLRVRIWVGTPVGLLAVPLASFLFDLAGGVRGAWERRLARTAVELLAVVPAWFFGWAVVQVFVLGWVWF